MLLHVIVNKQLAYALFRIYLFTKAGIWKFINTQKDQQNIISTWFSFYSLIAAVIHMSSKLVEKKRAIYLTAAAQFFINTFGIFIVK